MSAANQSRILQAVEALRRFDRKGAVALLAEEFRVGPPSGTAWRPTAKLCATIGEVDMSIEASRRFSRTQPTTLERLLHYWGELAGYGRTECARAEIERLPADAREHETVLHLLGTLAGQDGDFEAAEAYYRRALAKAPDLPQTWFALAMIKTFMPGDRDIAAMEEALPRVRRMDRHSLARFLYALAKARHDTGDYNGAFDLYSEGASLRHADEPYRREAVEKLVDGLIRDFTPSSMERLAPAAVQTERVIFVNGMPRSGTTLVEQILASHSRVADGGEVSLVRAAFLPTGDYSLAGARAYQKRAMAEGLEDPWGALAQDYRQMMTMRFGEDGMLVDKTLVQSHYMGLILHAMPKARVVWMQRDPEDVALSCFRTHFTSPIPWSWSLADIGHFTALEDQLFEHWSTLFPERILPVRYEDLVAAPEAWIGRILAHSGLPDEEQVHQFQKTRRAVRTASVQQVRSPISTSRIGQAEAYGSHLDAFRRAYAAGS